MWWHKAPLRPPGQLYCFSQCNPAAYLVVVPLDDLQKDRGPVLNWFGEDLEQVAFLIEIHQDFQFLEKGNRKITPRPTEGHGAASTRPLGPARHRGEPAQL